MPPEQGQCSRYLDFTYIRNAIVIAVRAEIRGRIISDLDARAIGARAG